MAKLTLQDLQYEDKKYKQWYAGEYGYDYVANKQVQDFIYQDVVSSIEFDLERNGEKSLVSKPGTHSNTIDGSTSSQTVTSADADAFAARYPQARWTGSKRKDAIQILKSGGTYAPEQVTGSTDTIGNEKKEEEKKSQPASAPEVKKVTTPIYPIPTDKVTHKVATKKSRLAFREKPSEVKVSTVADRDTEKKGKLIEMLDKGVKFTVLDPGVGYKCEWHHIKYGNKEGYVYNKFVTAVEDSGVTYLEYDCSLPKNTIFSISPDWTTKEPNVPFKDESIGKWNVSYQTEHESTGGSELEQRLLNSRKEATKLILAQLGKDTTDEYIESVVSAEAAIRVEDHFVSTKKNENMRVLVTLPIKYVSNLKDRNPEFEAEEEPAYADDDNEVFTGPAYFEPQEISSSHTRQIILHDSYKDRIKKVAKCMRNYAKQVQRFDGEVKNLDYIKEADRLEMLPQKFDNLLRQNGAPTTGMHSIELGLDDDFVCVYSSENSKGFYKIMSSGWDSFKDSEPIDSPRTMKYLFYLFDMQDSCKKNLEWIDFTAKYTDFPMVEIRPSAPKENSPADIRSASDTLNPSSSGNTAADKLDEEISPQDEQGEMCFNDLDSIADGLKGIKKSFKSAAEKSKEDLLLAGENIRNQIRDEGLVSVDFVGPPLLADIEGAMSKIKQLDDVFAQVMNKISLQDLIGAILECLVSDLNLNIDLDIDIPLPINLCLELPTIPSIDFPDSLPTMDIMADLSQEIFTAIVEALTEAFVQMLTDLIQSLLEMCKDADSDQSTDLNQALEDAANATSANEDEANKKNNKNKEDVLNAMGLMSNDFDAPLSPSEKAKKLTDLANILQDIGLLLEPSELCRLLKGRASAKTLSLVRSLLKAKYPDFYRKLNTKTKIKDLMIMIGRMVSSDFCDTLSAAPRTRFGSDRSCYYPEEDLLASPNASGLRGKGDNITEDQILEQLEKAKKRREDQAKQLQDLLNKLADIQAGRANPFQDAMPPLFCGEDSQGNPVEGLIKLKHDSIDFMLDKVLDTVFEPTYVAFNRDVKSYHTVVITTVVFEGEVAASFDAGDGNYIWHPELRRLEAQGITFDFDTGFKKAKKAKNEKIKVNKNKREVLPETKKLLNNLEESGAFSSKFDEEGVYYNLLLPPDPNTKEALNTLMDQIKEMEWDGKPSDVDLERLNTIAPDWNVRYKLPWQFLDSDRGQLVDDEYIIEIYPGEDPNSPLGLRREVVKNVHPDARDYIQGLYPDIEHSVFEPTGANTFNIENFSSFNSQITINADGSVINSVFASSELDCPPIEQNEIGSQEIDADIYSLYDENISPQEAYNRALQITPTSKRCMFIQLYMHKPEVWERLEDLYRESGCWDYVYVNKFARHILPPQQAVFGLHMRRNIYDKLSAIQTPITEAQENYLEDVRRFYSNFVQPQIQSDILALIAKEIANGELFNEFKSVDFSGGAGASDVSSSIPYLERVTLSREPDRFEKICGIDPSLLSVQQFKKAAKDAFENDGGICSLVEGIGDEENRDPLRSAMLKAVVKLTIRCYVIDYFLRGIFSFAEFSFEESLDDYVIEFMMKKMTEEILAYNDKYYDKFQDFVISDMDTALDEKEEFDPEPEHHIKPARAFEDNTDADSEEEYNTDADIGEETYFKILKELFLEQFAIVAVEMREVFERDPALKSISFENAKDLHRKALEDWIPVIDIPTTEGELRFSDTETKATYESYDGGDFITSTGTEGGTITSATLNGADSDDRQVIDEIRGIRTPERGQGLFTTTLLKNKTSWGDNNGRNFDLKNGNMFLERFYRIIRNDDESLNSFLSTLSEDIANKIDLSESQVNISERIDFAHQALKNAWHTVFDTEDREVYLSPEALDNTMLQLVSLIVTELNTFTYGENELQLFKTDVLLDGDSEVSQALWKIENYFSSIQPGMRLCYVPPVDVVTDYSATGNDSSGKVFQDMFNLSVEQNLGGSDLSSFYGNTSVAASNVPTDQNVLDALKKIGKKYKSYYVEEEFAYSQSVVYRTDTSDQDTSLSGAIRTYTNKRVIMPVPIVERFDNTLYAEVRQSSLLQVVAASTVDDLSGEVSAKNIWRQKFNSAKEKSIIDSLIESDEYAAIFKYAIPMDRFLGLLTVYTIMSVSAAQNVETIFAGTKDELRRLFLSLLNGSYKAEEGPNNADLARLLENFGGGISIPCFSFSFSGGFGGGFKGFGLDLILKLAMKTPLIIFKAIVEMIDPNIKIAKLIIDIGKFTGICLPMPAVSLGLLPPTVFGIPPFGIGIGPPLTPLGFVYLALGFEIPIGNPFKDGEDDDGKQKSTDEALRICEEREKKKKAKIERIRKRLEAFSENVK